VKGNKKRAVLLAAGLAFAGLSGQGKFCPAAEDHGPFSFKKGAPAVPERLEAAPGREPSLGVREIPRPDGGKDRVYFSVTPESDRRAREQAERNKLDYSLDALRNIIILGP
jgi:hypothetical protein